LGHQLDVFVRQGLVGEQGVEGGNEQPQQGAHQGGEQGGAEGVIEQCHASSEQGAHPTQTRYPAGGAHLLADGEQEAGGQAQGTGDAHHQRLLGGGAIAEAPQGAGRGGLAPQARCDAQRCPRGGT
ncbi:MAG: hypothetical protein ACK56I_28850, partial [bacterium]